MTTHPDAAAPDAPPLIRCPLPSDDPRFIAYHDAEWGHAVTDDDRLFEKVCLEGFQSGLSWQTILFKRAAFRTAFGNFHIDTVAAFDAHDVARLMNDAGIVRNHRKIESAINNAARARELREEFGSLGAFFWAFEPTPSERPTSVTAAWVQANPTTPASHRLSVALKLRGWSFVGPTNLYALMQAQGLVNDHVHDCAFRAAAERSRQRLDRPRRAQP